MADLIEILEIPINPQDPEPDPRFNRSEWLAWFQRAYDGSRIVFCFYSAFCDRRLKEWEDLDAVTSPQEINLHYLAAPEVVRPAASRIQKNIEDRALASLKYQYKQI